MNEHTRFRKFVVVFFRISFRCISSSNQNSRFWPAFRNSQKDHSRKAVASEHFEQVRQLRLASIRQPFDRLGFDLQLLVSEFCPFKSA